MLAKCHQATASDLPFYDIFAPQKVPFSKISDDVITCDLWFGPPQSKILSTPMHDTLAGPERENFPGGTKVDTGPPNLIGPPQALSGPMPLNYFLSNGCSSSFKSEGIAIFAYS